MKTNFLIIIACLMVFSTVAQTNKIATKDNFSDWEKVLELENQSLPQSALEVVNRIYQDALRNENSPQLIKSLIYRLKYEVVIDNDKLPGLIKEIEDYTLKDVNKTEQAVLYSFLAELYAKYYQNNSSIINQRTAVVSENATEDIETWSANLFIKKISDYVKLSLEPEEILQKTNVLAYKDILDEGKSSRELRPTLYDFLVYRGIDLLNQFVNNNHIQNYFTQTKLSDERFFSPAKEFVKLSLSAEEYDFTPQVLKLYQDLLIFHLRNNNPKALLMIDLDRLDFLKKTFSGDGKTYYLQSLQHLKEQYASNDFCVEIVYKIALHYGGLYTDEKAYKTCLEGIEKYPSYERIGILQNLLTEITQPNLRVYSNNAVYPEKELELNINYKNIDKLRLEIYSIDAPVSVYPDYWSRKGQYKNEKAKLVQTKEIILNNEYPYSKLDTIFKIPIKALGNYEYVIYADALKDQEPVNNQFSVSRLAVISKGIDQQREFLVVDRLSGKPVKGAQIKCYKKENNKLKYVENQTITTDKYGIATGRYDKDLVSYQAVFSNDTALLVSNMPWISSYSDNYNESKAYLSLFTDRRIYRPGQTVYLKGIAYKVGKDVQEVVPHKTYSLGLRDANHKEIVRKEFTTNDWGSFSGEFVLPYGALNGNFYIQTEDNQTSVSFHVEEYKRPTFDILFDKNEEVSRFGSEATVKGNVKSFSGVNLQDTKVQYRIVRNSHWLFRIYTPPVQVAEGEVQTQDDGSFAISFIPEKAFEDKNNKHVFYSFTIEASATDLKGETQQSETSINIGDKSICLNIDGLSDLIHKEKLPVLKIEATNLNGNPVKTKGLFEIYSLKPKNPEMFMKNIRPEYKTEEEWTKDKLVYSSGFETGKEIDISQLKSLPSGKYRVVAKGNPDLETVEFTKDFILASLKEKKPPVPIKEWLIIRKDTCSVGETAEFTYGSSLKNVHVLYEVFQENKKLATSRFVLNNENRKIEIPYLELYGDGIVVCLTFVKNSEVYTQNIPIRRKQADKKLLLKMEVFRDKLLPGQKEEWKISIKDAEKQPVSSELLAAMYDASLDKINRHSWGFSPDWSVRLNTPYISKGNEFQLSESNISANIRFIETSSFAFDTFNWFGFDISRQIAFITGHAVLKADKLDDMVSEKIMENSEEVIAFNPPNIFNSMSDQEKTGKPSAAQIRENFNETAFFYPHLKTNEAGETLISFTVPESNTTWKFMGLAHTKHLSYGLIVKNTISQKQLMVAPNVPRFIREGDKATISANISNLSEAAQSGTVSLEFFNPNSNQTTIVVSEASKPFAVASGKTVAVSWSVEVPSGIDLTAMKIVAKTADFSDGEQGLIPVLPNRILLTESLPLNISGGRTKTFSFDTKAKNSSPTIQNHRLTLEFTSNPVWYAVQALPAMETPQSDNVLSWFAAYYANSLAAQIVETTPKIRQIVNAWTQQGGSKETLLSNLEKNQELKTVLSEETPWVLEAKNETEQKQRLSLLFDINRNNNLSAQAIDKLRALQTDEGGWAWFKGMNSSVSITQWVLYGFGELGNHKVFQDIIENAVRFIDARFRKHYDDYKKNVPNWANTRTAPTSYELEYLFVRSLYKEIPLGETEEAVRFFSAALETHWAKIPNLYERALAALIFHRDGKQKLAEAILKSLREHASHKPDLGMFWANNNTHTFMFQSATTVHTFIMRAFHEVGSTSGEMDEMKLWLLKQKQTQEWESTPATVNAVQILLKTGQNWLESGSKVSIHWGDKTLDTSKGDAGTGYVKEVVESGDITPDLFNVTVSKADEGPAWGALYRQYFEDLDKITGSKSGLNVEKSLFVEKVTATDKLLIPVTENAPLKVGDKALVRLVVRADRDFEYVMLKDLRASCFEPVEQLSGIRWAQGSIYYQTPKDASMNYYFYNLAKGTYVFEYRLYVTASGNYSNGITTIQCLYAPEFVSHTSGGRIEVE